MSEQILTNQQVIETPAPQKKKRSLTRLIVDIVLLVLVLALTIATFASFATPVTRVGGNTISGESMSLTEYLIGQNSSSILSQVLNYLNMTEISDAQVMSIVSTLIRVYIIAVIILVYLIFTIVNVIKAIICFFAKKPLGLSTCAVKSLSFSFLMAVSLRFFASKASGEGESGYFTGVVEGSGLKAMLIVGAIILLAIAVVNFIFNKNKERKESTNFWIRSMATATIYTVMGGVIMAVGLAGILNQIINIPVTLVSALTTNLSLAILLTPLFNIWFFVATCLVLGRIRGAVKGSFRYLLCFGEDNIKAKVFKPSKASKGFILPLVVTIIVLAFVIIIKLPSLASGWQGDIFNPFILLFACSAIGLTVHLTFKDAKVIAQPEETVEEQVVAQTPEVE